MVVGGRPRCVVCLKLEVRDRTIPPHIRCHRCDGPFYCGRECQQKHWHHGGHREKCRLTRLEMGWFQGDGQNSLPLGPRDSAHDLVHAKKGWAPPGGWQQPDGRRELALEEPTQGGEAEAFDANHRFGGGGEGVGAVVFGQHDARENRLNKAMRNGAKTGYVPAGGGWGQATLINPRGRGSREEAARR